MRYSNKYLSFLQDARKYKFFKAPKRTRGVRVMRCKMDFGVVPTSSYLITDKINNIGYSVGASHIGIGFAKQRTKLSTSYTRIDSYYKSLLVDNAVELTARLLSAIHSYYEANIVKLVLCTVKIDPNSLCNLGFESPVSHALVYLSIDKSSRVAYRKLIPIMDNSRYKNLLVDNMLDTGESIYCDSSEPNSGYLEARHYSFMNLEEIEKEIKLLLSNNAII